MRASISTAPPAVLTSAHGARQRFPRALLLGIAALGVLGLAACAPEPGEAPASPAPTTSAPAPETLSAPEPPAEPKTGALEAPLVLPACNALVTPEQAVELGEPRYEELDAETSDRLAGVARDGAMGPAANAALDAATEIRQCSWGVPNSGSLTTLFVAVLSPEVRDDFRAALDASDFEKRTEGEATGYALTTENGIAVTTQWYLFSGDVWVAEVGRPEHRFAGAALAAVQAANAE